MDIDPSANTRDVDGRLLHGRGAIVIVEGLDKTGKSTLCKELYDLVPVPAALMHAGPPVVTTAIREYVWPLGIAGSGYTVICDRWHLGEMVWPTIFNRESLIPDQAALLHIEENMRYLRTPILALYMNRPLDLIRRELVYGGEDADYVEEANKLYGEAIALSSLDWRNTTLPKAVRIVVDWLSDVYD